LTKWKSVHEVSGDIAKINVDSIPRSRRPGHRRARQVEAAIDLEAGHHLVQQCRERPQSSNKSTYNRIKKLSESRSASAVELEQAEYNLNAAKFSVEQRKNEVSQARLNLSYATIKSPD
jgi:hypothetical protein